MVEGETRALRRKEYSRKVLGTYSTSKHHNGVLSANRCMFEISSYAERRMNYRIPRAQVPVASTVARHEETRWECSLPAVAAWCWSVALDTRREELITPRGQAMQEHA